MLAKRIIACLDVREGVVVKGIEFKNHSIVGDILELAKRYSEQGIDELVFYDITASCDQTTVASDWVKEVAKEINIPFCVAGGIDSVEKARAVLAAGADKISVNSPALNNPNLIDDLVNAFGSQCIVVGIDSRFENDDYYVYQYTGRESHRTFTKRKTMDWILEVTERGAGEIVLNCMNQDGKRDGYDIEQLKKARERLGIPLIASGGAGNEQHFYQVFSEANVDGALAASVFHKNIVFIPELKEFLRQQNITVRL